MPFRPHNAVEDVNAAPMQWRIAQLSEYLQKAEISLETNNEAALSERTCREWFQKFKNGDFDVEDKDRSGRPKIYEDAELEE
ncbi:Mariner Mos1 transposase [Eumeta japonica]|uniref:Mariner Mos1 transposase n=1 Tax=Eumeta variegata TaxID=151549 RepID=A0A4C1SAB9_EUMVA|nr:Mariner Mos1 transposase [Eumeta japonica]